jgi:hypothetical protein
LQLLLPQPQLSPLRIALGNPQALTPVVEGIIGRDMERFREYAQEYAKAAAATKKAEA